MITPSETKVSDLLRDLRVIADTIEECLLIGEKVECINEGGMLYNHLRSLVTPEYFSDDEYKWLCALGTSWNEEVKRYEATMGEHGGTKNAQSNQSLLDALQDNIDEMLDGFDGGDGAW